VETGSVLRKVGSFFFCCDLLDLLHAKKYIDIYKLKK